MHEKYKAILCKYQIIQLFGLLTLNYNVREISHPLPSHFKQRTQDFFKPIIGIYLFTIYFNIC